jgi:hypothetical protein
LGGMGVKEDRFFFKEIITTIRKKKNTLSWIHASISSENWQYKLYHIISPTFS